MQSIFATLETGTYLFLKVTFFLYENEINAECFWTTTIIDVKISYIIKILSQIMFQVFYQIIQPFLEVVRL